jgi:protein tyrosine kinase modulator
MDMLNNIQEMRDMVWRHIVLVVSVVCIGVLLSMAYAISLPKIYETAAVIQIEPPNIRDPLASSASINAAMFQQLQIIEQKVMARSNLLAISDELNLFANQPGIPEAQKVYQFRQAASVISVIDPSLSWRPDITPTALNITVRLQDPVLAAKVANALVDNIFLQERERREVRVGETLAFFESEETRVGEAIEALEAKTATYRSENAAALPAGLAGLRAQLLELQSAELDIYSHIIQLETRSGTAGSTVTSNRLVRLEQQRDLLRKRIDEIETSLEASPEVERTLSALARQHTKLSDQYGAITRNRAEAEMGQMLDASRQSDSFEVLERAPIPLKAISPNRRQIVLLGSVLSLVAAFAASLILEMRNPVIRTAMQLQRLAGEPPIAVIPNLEGGVSRNFRKVLKGVSVLITLAITGVLAFMLMSAG